MVCRPLVNGRSCPLTVTVGLVQDGAFPYDFLGHGDSLLELSDDRAMDVGKVV